MYIPDYMPASDNEETLFSEIPTKVRISELPDLPGPMGEMQLWQYISALAAQNIPAASLSCFTGAGVYDHFCPAAVDQLILRQEFYTAYTPYQPEISQGTLMGLFEFQSGICELTGMDAANASMYDVTTAAAEAVNMIYSRKSAPARVILAGGIHPQLFEVLHTYSVCHEIEVVKASLSSDGTSLEGIKSALGTDGGAVVIVQSPNYFGIIEDMETIAALAHEKGAGAVAVCDPLSLALLRSPGECGMDIVVGECQSLGLPMSFGGPYAGYLACKSKYLRKMPGRIIGKTTDTNGNDAYVLTMQAREQHIRREKATSNICSNQSLCALSATIYMSLMGSTGMRRAATLSALGAARLCDMLCATGKFERLFTSPYFREFALRVKSGNAEKFLTAMRQKGILAGVALGIDFPEYKDAFIVSVTEKRSEAEIESYVKEAVLI